MSILTDIEALAQRAAKEALGDEAKLQERLDALKILAPYYLTLAKGRGKDDEGDEEPTISDIQHRLRVVEQEVDDGSDPAGTVPNRGHRRAGSE